MSAVNSYGESHRSNQASATPRASYFSDTFATSAASQDLNFESTLNVNSGGRQSGVDAPLTYYEASNVYAHVNAPYYQVNNSSLGAADALLLGASQPNWYWSCVYPNYNFIDSGQMQIDFDLTLTTPQSPNQAGNAWVGLVVGGAGATQPGSTVPGFGVEFTPDGVYSAFDDAQALPTGSFTLHAGTPYHIRLKINTTGYSGNPAMVSLDIDGVHKLDYVRHQGFTQNYLSLQEYVWGGSGENYATFANLNVGPITSP